MELKASGNCKTSDIVHVARCKICDILYVGETKDELRIRFSKHRYDAKKRPENCELTAHVHANNHDFEKDIEVTILQQGFKSEAERKFVEDKYIPTGPKVLSMPTDAYRCLQYAYIQMPTDDVRYRCL